MELFRVYKEALASRYLGSIINRGNICFIPKEGDLELITNWRHITLLNVSYKIIAKALDLKLRIILSRSFN